MRHLLSQYFNGPRIERRAFEHAREWNCSGRRGNAHHRFSLTWLYKKDELAGV
ncbi:hypothetical protein NWI01_35460 [Nitrobacter winogradskyi]|uniref:Uncharacterized protein n=1 Tax=Nitrobacter winogradskyi TaxID=913 RepID=A0A4Y3WFK8_NITWI|nr:hypothetical protein NWI01_35460 [Nitrobacter winogradskyi]